MGNIIASQLKHHEAFHHCQLAIEYTFATYGFNSRACGIYFYDLAKICFEYVTLWIPVETEESKVLLLTAIMASKLVM